MDSGVAPGMEQNKLDFEGLAHELLSRSRDLLPSWLPGGRFIGNEYTCGNLRGEPGDSLKVNANSGKWADFATGDTGGDLISLYAAIHGIGQGEAYKQLASDYRSPADNHPATVRPSSTPATRQPRIEDDLTPPPNGATVPGMQSKWGAPSAYWIYRSTEGAPLFYVARYDVPNERKQFIPWSWSKSQEKWIQKGWPAPRPLYGLELLAQYPDHPVLIVEGEKAADAARRIAGHVYVVVTWPNGSNAGDKVDWSPIHGRKVLIWPDADEAGIKVASVIAAQIHAHCLEIKTIDVAGDLSGRDAADALEDGWDFRALVAWAKPRARIYESSPKEPEILPAKPEPTPAPPEPEDEDPGPSMGINALVMDLGLAVTHQGNPICNADNVMRILEGFHQFKGSIWYDEFYNKIFTTWGSQGPRTWRDVDDINLMLVIQREFGMARISREAVSMAVVSYAHRNTRNEPQDWIQSLKWDGIARLDMFFTDAYGAEENAYSRAVSKNFWISMVARVMRPGCQVDNMVILEGKQGIRKSSSLRVIGGRWYSEANHSIGSDDFLTALHGNIIMEIGELNSFSKAESTRIKQVITNPVDEFRPKYGRHAQKFPRRCILVGTTNEDTYLKDPTGARRFWPIKTNRVDVEYITEQREQFFAEALHRLNAGESWWEVPLEETEQEQEQRQQTDVWESVIYDFLLKHGSDEIAVRDLIVDALKIEIGRADRAIEMRCANVLKRLGWSKLGQRTTGGVRKVYWKRDEL